MPAPTVAPTAVTTTPRLFGGIPEVRWIHSLPATRSVLQGTRRQLDACRQASPPRHADPRWPCEDLVQVEGEERLTLPRSQHLQKTCRRSVRLR